MKPTNLPEFPSRGGIARSLINFAFALAAAVAAFSTRAVAAEASRIAENFQADYERVLEYRDSLPPALQKVSLGLVVQAQVATTNQSLKLLPQTLVAAATDAAAADADAPAAPMLDCNIKCLVSDRLRQLILDHGGEIVSASERFGAIHAHLPAAALATVAADAAVKSINTVRKPCTNRTNLSEGVRAHRADIVQSIYGVTGADVRVGVISDSAEQLTALKKSGDLPSDSSIVVSASGTSEGSAMMEVVYDTAPGASLRFASCLNTVEEFAESIYALENAGCKVITDDMYFCEETAFQDGPISVAINDFVGRGGVYTTCACNYGSTANGNSQCWIGDFKSCGHGETRGGKKYEWHQFAGKNTDSNPIESYVNGNCVITLQWSDPCGGSANDYDLFLINGVGNIIDSGVTVQNGAGDPYEEVVFNPNHYLAMVQPVSVVIAKTSTAAKRCLQLMSSGVTFKYSTHSSITGHHSNRNAITVAAASAAANRAFIASDPLEDFSSDGPGYRFFNADGSRCASGYLLADAVSCGKPDVTAADNVATATSSTFNPFFGTSCAAPHAAGIAALMLEANPSLTQATVKSIMSASAFAGSSGWNINSGYGILDAAECVRRAIVRRGKSAAVVATVNEYGKWYLADDFRLSAAVAAEAAGKSYSVKAEGLPAGLKLGRDGKKWFLAGAPTAYVDLSQLPIYLTITVGKETFGPVTPLLKLSDRDADSLGRLKVNVQTTLTDALAGVGKGWKVSGLPKGLSWTATKNAKYAANTIYGKPTAAGWYTVTATKKVSTHTLVKKFSLVVLNADGSTPAQPSTPSAPTLDFNTSGGVLVNATCGVNYSALRSFSTDANAKVTAAGLPKGITLKQVSSGKWALAGCATAAKLSYVTVAATLNGVTTKQRLALKFNALPTWATGNFTDGVHQFTIGATGKVSGKFAAGGTNFVYSASALSSIQIAGGVTNFFSYGEVACTFKENGKTVKSNLPLVFRVNPPASTQFLDSSISLQIDDGEILTLPRNLWSDADAKKYLAKSGLVGKHECAATAAGENFGTLKYSVTAAGKVTISGTLTPSARQQAGLPAAVVKKLSRKISVSTILYYDSSAGAYLDYTLPSATVSTVVTETVAGKRVKKTYSVEYPAITLSDN